MGMSQQPGNNKTFINEQIQTQRIDSEHEEQELWEIQYQRNSGDATYQNNFQYPTNRVRRKMEKADLYKTEMCKSFTKFGFCRYNNKCQFAHEEKELRDVSRHPRYKT